MNQLNLEYTRNPHACLFYLPTAVKKGLFIFSERMDGVPYSTLPIKQLFHK